MVPDLDAPVTKIAEGKAAADGSEVSTAIGQCVKVVVASSHPGSGVFCKAKDSDLS